MNFKPDRLMLTTKTAKTEARRVTLIGYGFMFVLIVAAIAVVVLEGAK